MFTSARAWCTISAVSLVPPAESHAIDLHGGALLALIDLAASTDAEHGRSLHALVSAALDAIGAEAAIVLDNDAVLLAVPERVDCGELKRAGRLATRPAAAGLVSTVRWARARTGASRSAGASRARSGTTWSPRSTSCAGRRHDARCPPWRGWTA